MKWFIDHFKSLADKRKHHVYSIFLQQELDTFKVAWNNHYKRKSKNSQISGIPDELFSTSQLHSYVNCCKEISLEESDTFATLTTEALYPKSTKMATVKTFSVVLRISKPITTNQLWLNVLITLPKKND